MRARIRTIVAGLATLAALAVATPAQAATAAALGTAANPFTIAANSGCGSSCDGKDPSVYAIYYSGRITTCSADAITARVNTSGGITLELRYSPICRTAWTRVPSDYYYPYIRSYYPDGRLRVEYNGFKGAYYSQMVNDANLLAEARASAGPTVWTTGRY
ncbi:DUF2690 domain-containing protein [Micromonospora sp. WP24]|uniref:DUF2690 domain-containing protein n=1 Tax=Micromonospora sp. WP24 TaxID=2604469 RepID=UPI0011D33C10|nr:DUF2690 domain-containing protein [Micromonospora sp. WP24]TYC01877.1 DUF2690 domain-containing protein [Micromonospora sp. WP24]